MRGLPFLLILSACLNTSQPSITLPIEQPDVNLGWLEPVMLGDATRELLFAPCITVSTDTIYVLGSTTPYFTGELAPVLTMVAASRNGGHLRRSMVTAPPAAQIPYCALTEDNTLLAVWAEIDPARTFTTESPMHTPILTAARYRNGRWTNKVSHNYGFDVSWSHASIVEGFDQAFYAAPSYREVNWSAIAIIRIDTAPGHSTWETRKIPIAGGYSHIAFTRDDDQLLAYISAARADSTTQLKTDTGSVFFDNLDDDRDSVIVNRSGLRAASDLRMVVTDDDRIHLIWLRAPEGTNPNEVWGKVYVYHTFSSDGGLTWTTPTPISPLFEGFIDLRFAARPGGGLYLIIDVATHENGGTLYYLSYDGAVWTEAETVFETGLTMESAITVTDDGALHLFTNYLPPESPITAYRPVYLSRPPQP